MEETGEILSRVRRAAQQKVLFLPHALRQMLRPDRMINRMEVRRVIAEGEVIEDYPEEDQKMKCIHCEGEMKKGTVPFHVYRKGCHLVLDAVPAWICDQCGEAYFEEKEVDAIQELVRSMEQQAEALSLTA